LKRYDFDTDTVTPMFNVWGSERVSQPGLMSVILDYGESLGDIEVNRLIRVCRTFALYEANRKLLGKGRGKGMRDERVLLKVAHNNASELLKAEAITLAKLSAQKQHPMLPKLLPAYQVNDGEQQRPYGKTVFQGEQKYYTVFKYYEGDFLRDMLTKNPQPWYQHVGWLTISLCDVVHYVHKVSGQLVVNLNPESIMVRIDRDGIMRPTLIDLSLSTAPEEVDPENVRTFVYPAYTAPELLNFRKGDEFGPQADVYGLGLITYEMLAGRPAYPYRLRAPENILESVGKEAPPRMNRSDLRSDIAEIVVTAVDRNPNHRHNTVKLFAKAMMEKFGEVPAERSRWPWWLRVIGGVLAILAFVFIVWFILNVVITPS
jgi:serine/threonine protein kinase